MPTNAPIMQIIAIVFRVTVVSSEKKSQILSLTLAMLVSNVFLVQANAAVIDFKMSIV